MELLLRPQNEISDIYTKKILSTKQLCCSRDEVGGIHKSRKWEWKCGILDKA